MNKKVFTVLSAAVVGSTFWACGSGEIFTKDQLDDVVEGLTTTPEGVLALCDGKCYVEEPVSSSAAEIKSSSSTVKRSSSSRNLSFSPGGTTSSSSIATEPVSSASAPKSKLGSCAPVETPINKKGLDAPTTTTFTFTPDLTSSGISSMKFAKATYAWSFGADATPSTSAGKTSDAVSFANSGVHTVKVHVTVDGQEGDITCDPLQVNGDPIIGCECTSPAASVDYTESPDVAWSLSGSCTSASMPLSYLWNGTEAGSDTYVRTFEEAQDGWAPTVSVSNTDNTVISVVCPKVKTTKGPEFTLDGTTAAAFTVGVGEYSMVYACKTDQYYQTPVLAVTSNGVTAKLKVDGKDYSVGANGQISVYSSTTPNTFFKVEVISGTATFKCG